MGKDKKFKKKFMHPTRRKLVDMVHTGKYDKDTKISQTTGDDSNQTREVGDEWKDKDGNLWVQKNGYKIKKSKNTDTLSKVRKEIENKQRCSGEKCEKKGKYGPTDKQLIEEVGLCSSCLVEKEIPIRKDGNYETYTRYKMFSNIYKEGQYYHEKLTDAYDEVKPEYEYVDGDGKVQTWVMEKPVDELKAEIQEDIDDVEKKLKETEEKMSELYDKLKDYDYELVNKIKMDIEDD